MTTGKSMEAIDDKVISRIKKLMNKAEGAKEIGSLVEAEAFLMKANELMIENNLSMMTIEEHSIDKSRVGESDWLGYGKIKSDGSYEVTLASIVARYNMCDVIYIKSNRAMSFIGRPENVNPVIFMYEIARDSIVALSRESYIEKCDRIRDELAVDADGKELAAVMIGMELDVYVDPSHISKRKLDNKYTITRPELYKLVPYREVYIRNFLKGATMGIMDMFEEKKRVSERSGGIYALVLRSASAELDEYMDNRKVRKIKDRNEINDASAFSDGREAGKSVTLSAGIGAAPNNKRLTQ